MRRRKFGTTITELGLNWQEQLALLSWSHKNLFCFVAVAAAALFALMLSNFILSLLFYRRHVNSIKRIQGKPKHKVKAEKSKEAINFRIRRARARSCQQNILRRHKSPKGGLYSCFFCWCILQGHMIFESDDLFAVCQVDRADFTMTIFCDN